MKGVALISFKILLLSSIYIVFAYYILGVDEAL